MKKLKLLNSKRLISLSMLTFCLICQSAAFSQNVKVKTIKSSIQDAGLNLKNPVTVKSNNSEKQMIDKYSNQLRTNHFNKNYQNSKTINLKTEFNFFPENVKVDFAFRDLDLPTALRLLGKEGGKNIVIDSSIKGSINLDLRNVFLNNAMEIILTSQELESRISGNTIFIASRVAMSKKGLNRRYVKAFKLNNSNAVDIASILESSVFNKGYYLDEKAASNSSDSKSLEAGVAPATTSASVQSGSLGALPSLSVPAVNNVNPQASSTSSTVENLSQSKLSEAKELRSKVEAIDSGTGFNDANIPAAKIKLQGITTSYSKINVSNNDGGAIVIPDSRTNSVLIAGLKEDIELATEAINYLDKPLEQIAVEVSLIEIKESDWKNLGFSGTVDGLGGKSFNFLKNTKDVSVDTFIYNNPLVPKVDTFSYNINLLRQKDKVKLLANPTIVTLDGSESLIKITDEILRSMKVTVATPTSPTMYEPELAEVGIVLNILPKVSSDGNVTMRIRPSVTSAGTKIPYPPDGNFVTPISTREVILQDTRVKSGQTLAIAGLMKNSELESIKTLPGLGDLKIFGSLFKNKSFTKEKTELIILITPRILEEVQAN